MVQLLWFTATYSHATHSTTAAFDPFPFFTRKTHLSLYIHIYISSHRKDFIRKLLIQSFWIIVSNQSISLLLNHVPKRSPEILGFTSALSASLYLHSTRGGHWYSDYLHRQSSTWNWGPLVHLPLWLLLRRLKLYVLLKALLSPMKALQLIINVHHLCCRLYHVLVSMHYFWADCWDRW